MTGTLRVVVLRYHRSPLTFDMVLAVSGGGPGCELRPCGDVEDECPDLGDYECADWPQVPTAGLWLLEWDWQQVQHPEDEFDTTLRYGAHRFAPITEDVLREFGLIPTPEAHDANA